MESEPRESRMYNGRGYILEEAITGDFALIKVRILLRLFVALPRIPIFIYQLSHPFFLLVGMEGGYSWQRDFPWHLS